MEEEGGSATESMSDLESRRQSAVSEDAFYAAHGKSVQDRKQTGIPTKELLKKLCSMTMEEEEEEIQQGKVGDEVDVNVVVKPDPPAEAEKKHPVLKRAGTFEATDHAQHKVLFSETPPLLIEDDPKHPTLSRQGTFTGEGKPRSKAKFERFGSVDGLPPPQPEFAALTPKDILSSSQLESLAEMTPAEESGSETKGAASSSEKKT